MKKMISLIVITVAMGVTTHATLLFEANYNGTTGNGGLDADYAAGSAVATSMNGVSLAPGALGTGAYFPSNTSANVSLQYNATSNIKNDKGTVEFWYKPAYNSSVLGAGGSYRVFNVRNTAANRFIDLYTGDINGAAPGGESLYNYSDTFGGQNSAIIGAFSTGTLMHFALTWDNTTGIQFFINGVGSGLYAHTWAANSHTQDVIFAGSSIYGSIQNAAGTIDLLRIYDNVKYTGNFSPFAEIIPEPGVGALLLTGAALLWAKRRR